MEPSKSGLDDPRNLCACTWKAYLTLTDTVKAQARPKPAQSHTWATSVIKQKDARSRFLVRKAVAKASSRVQTSGKIACSKPRTQWNSVATPQPNQSRYVWETTFPDITGSWLDKRLCWDLSVPRCQTCTHTGGALLGSKFTHEGRKAGNIENSADSKLFFLLPIW